MTPSTPYAVPGGILALSGPVLRDCLTAVLDRGVPFRFAARGVSMYPSLRDGDVVTVAPLAGSAPRVGDVVAFRNGEERLVVHRVVAARDDVVEIRGDNCPSSDGVFERAAVLGIVARVERAGREVHDIGGARGRVAAELSRRGWLRPARAAAHLPRRAAGRALRAAQGAPACRRGLRRLRPTVTITAAAPADAAEVRRRFGILGGFCEPHSSVDARGFAARVRLGGRDVIAGIIELVRRDESAAPFDGWWIHAVTVATPFRGMGVGSLLVDAALAVAEREGADEVRLLVGARNTPALELYRRHGFVPWPDAPLDDVTLGRTAGDPARELVPLHRFSRPSVGTRQGSVTP